MRTLVVTNDFPPVLGGIETFAWSLASRLPGEVTVLTRAVVGSAAVDSAAPFEVIRVPMSPLLPGQRLARWVAAAVRRTAATAVWFPSSAPLALLAGTARRAGADVVVASTHGHEIWWGAVPGPRSVLRRIAGSVDALTYDSEYTGRRIGHSLPRTARLRLVRLSPGVDPEVFRPDAAARARVRGQLGIGDRPMVLAVSRLVPRKGHDRLLAAWPAVRSAQPQAELVVIGDGPRRALIERAASRLGGPSGGVHILGGMPWADTPPWFAAADVFAVPTRTRLAGLETEAFGICYLEAAAAGLAVVAGRSGGTPEVVADGVTGAVVDGRRPAEIVAAITAALSSPELARRQGDAGRAASVSTWSWDAAAGRLSTLLSGRAVGAPVGAD